MTLLEAALRQVLGDLYELDVRWALIGGLAVSARAEPRTTRDIDVAVAANGDEQAERLVFALQSMGYGVQSAVEHDAVERLATVRMTPPEGEAGAVLVDLMFASSGIEPEIAAEAEQLELLPGLSVPVARTGHLIAMKILARDDRHRPQDWDDIRALLRVAGAEEVRLARAALDLIRQRGYARGKDLVAELEELIG
jgi:predicted nucleotidyltransferase